MSENFPFNSADEFLDVFKNDERRDMETDQPLEISVHAPDMPDKTPIQTGARTMGVGLLAIGAITQDKWVLLAAIVGSVIIECVRMLTDTMNRKARNERIGLENVATIDGATHIRSTSIENG